MLTANIIVNNVNVYTLLAFFISSSCFSYLNAESKSSHNGTNRQNESSKRRTPEEIRRLLYGNDQTLKCGEQLLIPQTSQDSVVKPTSGHRAHYGEFPWHVALFKTYPPVEVKRKGQIYLWCGAVVIGNYWLLTAAHCLYRGRDFVGPMYALIGTHDLTIGPDGEWNMDIANLTVGSSFVHPKFDYLNNTNYESDIAILKTTEKIDLTGQKLPINSVCLPGFNKEPTLWQPIMTGFGSDDAFEFEKYLKVAEFPLLTHDECKNQVPMQLDDATFCAGFRDGEHVLWDADAGGPLIQFNDTDTATLIGINVAGNFRSSVSIYTQVSSYIDWIFDTIEANLNA